MWRGHARTSARSYWSGRLVLTALVLTALVLTALVLTALVLKFSGLVQRVRSVFTVVVVVRVTHISHARSIGRSHPGGAQGDRELAYLPAGVLLSMRVLCLRPRQGVGRSLAH
jgi:hypothetical protein